MAFKELKEFKANEQQLTDKLQELREERKQLEAEQAEAADAYGRMLAEDAAATKKHTQKDLSAQKRKIDELSKQAADVADRIATVERHRDDVMTAQLPNLKAGYDRANKEVKAATQAKIGELEKRTAEYLLLLREIRELDKKAMRIHSEWQAAAGKYDESVHRVRLTLLNVNLFNDYYSFPRGLREQEQRQALTAGTVPHWVALYGETGDVVLDNGEAAAKLCELRGRK